MNKELEQQENPNLVGWDGLEDPENPKNWSLRKKWATTFIVSSFTFISPVSSSMVAPALNKVAKEFGITSGIETALTLSIFVLAYGLGPLLMGPLSEMFGRSLVLQVSNWWYLLWNLGCGLSQTRWEMFLFRFLSGIGGSTPVSVGGAVLGDCWTPDQRGKAVGIYSLAPLLGPIVGPIAGGFIAEYTTWRWVFFSTTIAAASISLSGVLFLQETHEATLLRRKAARLRKETGNDKLFSKYDNTESFGQRLSQSLVRPFKMLTTQPIIQLIALYGAYIFGVMYLLLATFPGVFEGVYGESISIGGLNYLSLSIGAFLGTLATCTLNDRIYKRLKMRNNDVGRPEFRIPSMFVGSLLVPIGLFWYGWSVEGQIHWIVPNIGMVIVGTGFMNCLQCMQMYTLDSYTRFAASGFAAAVVLRSLFGFGFPLFASNMYSTLGYGWGTSVLGFISIGIGIPLPFIFWYFGAELRRRSQFAAG